MSAALRLWGRTSSINVRKVLWTADEIGLEVDQRDPSGSGAARLRDFSPHGLTPVIEDDELVLWESNTICRYLAHKHARTDLLPATPQARAGVEMWMDWQAAELNPVWRYAFMSLVRGDGAYRDANEIARSERDWNARMRVLDARLAATGAYVTGHSFTLADIVVALSVHRWRETPIDRPGLAAVDAYLVRLADRPGFHVHCVTGVP